MPFSTLGEVSMQYTLRPTLALCLKFVILVMTMALSYGQTARATLTGVITDPSGAVMANVEITAKHVETGATLVGTTSSTGNYTIAQLPVGLYEVSVEQPGFKTFRREGMT